ncbi:helix-turn-helix transcriptional regulator [Chitinasiproducens palmae]|uniref:AraC-type DNA-binding protein n=1 Tax=Chitinasiproducens palmae TaxID=1770053 RepID=A0A1H2PW70_9BURK|nr:AraC family transcriptional regulator [Chitinasiproducens palmae]SDV51250.1 AraC-type DNA-binding protein [Chitinasiproducens palmae]
MTVADVPRSIPDVAGAAPTGYELVSDETFGRRRLLRARPTSPGVAGERAYLHVGSGMSVSASALHHVEPGVETILGGGVLKMHVRLAGESMVGVGRCDRSIAAQTCSALIHPRGERKLERFDGAVSEQSVTVACSAAFLAEEYGLDRTPQPAPLARFLAGSDDARCDLDLQLRLDTRIAARAILDDFFGARPEPMLIEARALELLGQFFSQVRDSTGTETVRPYDRRLAAQAREALDASLEEPPALAALARSVGTHPAKLMRVFKAVHGLTISEYVEAARMARAHRLLADENVSVTSVALEVGYRHPGNFATAFKRHFGILPSAVRHGR